MSFDGGGGNSCPKELDSVSPSKGIPAEDESTASPSSVTTIPTSVEGVKKNEGSPPNEDKPPPVGDGEEKAIEKSKGEEKTEDDEKEKATEDGKTEPKEPGSKRKYHKETEKKRREKINRLIEDLIELVPMCRNSPYKLDKLTVLKMAVYHLKMLRQKKAAEGIFSPFKPLSVKEDDMRFLLEQAGDGFLFVLASERAQVLYISEVVTDVIGSTPASMIGRSLYTMIHSRDIPILKEQIKPFGSLPSVTNARTARMETGGRLEPEVGCMSGSRRSFYCRFHAVEKTAEGEGQSEFRLIDKIEAKATDRQYEDGNFFVTVFCTGFLKTWQVADRPLYEVPDDIELSTSTCFIGIGRSVHSIPTDSRKAKLSEKALHPTAFTSRHSADAKFLYVDSSVVPICGFLPQDLVGQSEYDYVHHDDVSVLADTFRKVVHLKEQEKVVSNVYRAKVKGGGVIQMRTVAFSLFNPFSKELEYIVNRNYVVCESGSGVASSVTQPVLNKSNQSAKSDNDSAVVAMEESELPAEKEVSEPPTMKDNPSVSTDGISGFPWIPGNSSKTQPPNGMPLLVDPVTAQLVLSRPGHVVDPVSGTMYAAPPLLPDRLNEASRPTPVKTFRPPTAQPKIVHSRRNVENSEDGRVESSEARRRGVLMSSYGASGVKAIGQEPNLQREAEENVRILATAALALHDGKPFAKQAFCTDTERGKKAPTEVAGNHRHSNINRNHKGHSSGKQKAEVFTRGELDGLFSHNRLGRPGKSEAKQVPQPKESRDDVFHVGLMSFIQESVGKAVRDSLPSLLSNLYRENNPTLAPSSRHDHVMSFDRGMSSSASPCSDSSSSTSSRDAVTVEPVHSVVDNGNSMPTSRKTSVISCVGKCSSSDSSNISSETSDPGSSEEEENSLKDLQGCRAEKAESSIEGQSESGSEKSLLFHDNLVDSEVIEGRQDSSSSLSSSPDITVQANSRKRKRADRREDVLITTKDPLVNQLFDSGNETDVSGENSKRACVAQLRKGQFHYLPAGLCGPTEPSNETIGTSLEGLSQLPNNNRWDEAACVADRNHKGKNKTYAQIVGSVENVLRDHLSGGVTYAGRQCDTGHLAARILSILGINGLPQNFDSNW